MWWRRMSCRRIAPDGSIRLRARVLHNIRLIAIQPLFPWKVVLFTCRRGPAMWPLEAVMDGGGSRDAMRWPARRRSNTEFYEPVSNGYANELSPCPIGMPGLSANILLLFFFFSIFLFLFFPNGNERKKWRKCVTGSTRPSARRYPHRSFCIRIEREWVRQKRNRRLKDGWRKQVDVAICHGPGYNNDTTLWIPTCLMRFAACGEVNNYLTLSLKVHQWISVSRNIGKESIYPFS